MKNRIFDILKLIIIGLILELTLFNISTYISLLRPGEKFIVDIGENYEFLESEDSNKLIIPIDNINKEIKSIKINQKENPIVEYFEYRISYSDETSSKMRDIQNTKHFITDTEKTQHINMFLSGNVSTIWIETDKNAIESGDIASISFNETIPLKFNLIRFLIVTGIFIFIYFVNKVEKTYDTKNLKQEILLIIALLFIIIVCNVINDLAGANEFDVYSKDFVDAIKKGQVYLERNDSVNLSKLEDPYDTLTRDTVISRDTDYLWDTAYYNGNYYVYFGIVPLLTLLLPFNLITGKYMLSNMAVLIYSVMSFILLKEVLCKIIKRYFKGLSFKIVLSSFIILSFGSLVLFANGIPRNYEVAVVSGLTFSLFGIFCILEATEKEKVNYIYMFLGALSLALAVGCRPTYLLVSILIVPLLIKLLVQSIKNNDKKSIIKEIISIGIPYIVVGIALMYYNYIRFGSILEFGANYQLTINNMQKLGSRIFVVIQGLWCNLFSLPTFIEEFPYLGNHNDFNFNGYYYIENMIGGLFILAPICFMNFYIFKNLKNKDKKEINILTIITFIVGLVIAVLSVMMAGSNQRYIIDYAWLMIASGLFTFFGIYLSFKSDEAKKIFEKIIIIVAVYTMLINIAAGIVSEKSYIKENSRQEFYKMKYTVCFWE